MRTRFSLIALLAVVCFVSCSDDEGAEEKKGKLSPPEWIIGIWEWDSDLSGSIKAEFTKNNLIFSMGIRGSEQTRNFVEESKETVIPVTLSEPIKTDTEYQINITRGAGAMSGTNTYKFEKKSDSEIIYVLYDNEIDPVLTRK